MEQGLKRILDERYEITRQTSCCGETVVYLGRDIVSQSLVTIKEFFAGSIMQRDASGSAEVIKGCEVQYKSLSSDYEELCNYLKQFPENFPILRPIDIIWCNNTVYSIEKYSETETLDDYLARRGHVLNWNQLKRMITPIVKLLSKMHADGVYHRGISPETLLVDSSNSLVLSGFCIPAARTAESEISSTLYFGYSAPEQYSSNSWQGSWSDVYSLAAVCYRALTGITPVEWRQRGDGRELLAPKDNISEIPQNVSDALIKALTIDLRSRYRTIEELWCALLVGHGQGTVTYQLPIQKRTEEQPATSLKNNNVRPLLAVMALISLVAIFSLALAYRLVDTYFQPPPSSSESVDESSAVESSEVSQAKIVVPDLVGINIEKVLLDPLYQRLFTFQIERVFSESQPAGVIVAQQPKAGNMPGDSAQIYVWVSKGSERIIMPDVQNMEIAKATAQLDLSEIEYTIELVEPSDDQREVKNGTVLDTSVPVGSIVYRNTDTVIIYVAKLPEPESSSESSSYSWDEDYVVRVKPRTETYWPNNQSSESSSDDTEK